MSKYPSKIDDIVSLPPVKDKFTKITQDTINNLIDAIINIENEMGIKPSSKYIDVKTRIDYLEYAASNISKNNSMLMVSDPAKPGQTLIYDSANSKWKPETDFIAKSIKTTGQSESGLINSAGVNNGLTIIDGKMIFKGLPSAPKISDSGGGAIYFDKTDGFLKFSENGGPYKPLANLRSAVVQPNFFARQDVSGDYLNQTVIGIRKIPISTVSPINGQALLYDDGALSWIPGTNFKKNDIVTKGKAESKSLQVTSITSDGVVKSDAAGNISAGLIFDDDVDSAAAIDGTKIISNFENQDVSTAGNIIGDGYGSINKIVLDMGGGPSISSGSLPPTSTTEKIGSIYTDKISGIVYIYYGPTVGWKMIQGNAVGPASGELSGNYPNPIVSYINGTQSNIVGASLLNGNVLKVVSNKIESGPITLDGGPNHVVGILPKSNQASQTMGGDVSGKTNATKVEKLRGRPISLLSPINDKSCLIYDAISSSWQISGAKGSASPSGPAGGDLTWEYPNPIVNKINGGNIKTYSSVSSIKDKFISSGSTISLLGITATQSKPSVFAVIPMTSFNVTLTISDNLSNILQVFASDGYHMFGSPLSGPYWSNYNTDASNINAQLITKENEFDYGSTSYNGSGLQITGSSSYASVSGDSVSYSVSSGVTTLSILGKLKKSLILVITSNIAVPAASYTSNCSWSYTGNIIPRKGYILISKNSTSASPGNFIYRPIDLSNDFGNQKLPASNQEPLKFVGDVIGDTKSASVKKIKNIPIIVDKTNLVDGYVFGIQSNASGTGWVAFGRTLGSSPTGPANGDLKGNYDDTNGPSVNLINDNLVSILDSSKTEKDYVFSLISANGFSYNQIDLNNNTLFSGTLPLSKQGLQIFSGDVAQQPAPAPNDHVTVQRLNGTIINAPSPNDHKKYLKVNTGSPANLIYSDVKLYEVDGYFNLSAMTSPGVSSTNSGIIYFDLTDKCFKISEGGRPYRKLLAEDSSVRKITKLYIQDTPNPQSLTIDAAHDACILQLNNSGSITSNLNLIINLPASSDPNILSTKMITVSVIGLWGAYCEMTFVPSSGDAITISGTIRKSSVTLILDQLNKRWLYVNSGS